MPPKGSTKPKALTGAGVTKSAKKEVSTKKEPGTPATPTDELQNVALETPTKTKPKARPAQKKTKSNISPEKAFNALKSILDSDGSNLGDATPIDVSYENATPFATPTIHSGAYGQQIRLRAPQPFSVVKSVLFTEGPYAGHQAILLEPAKPFKFMCLPLELRKKIYYEYLFPTHNEKGVITFSTSPLVGVKAKSYAQEAKHRLALLEVNKQISEEARLVLYSFALKFDTSKTLLNFLSAAAERVRVCIASVIVAKYDSISGSPALNVLATSKCLNRLRISDGFGKKQTPEKAAKVFFIDARKFLHEIGTLKNHPHGALGVISWGNNCFTIKENGEVRPWGQDEEDEFIDALKAKLK